MPKELMYSHDLYKGMSVDEAANELGNRVYSVIVPCFEAQEHAGNIYGNGHHLAQDVVEYVRKLLLDRKRVDS